MSDAAAIKLQDAPYTLPYASPLYGPPPYDMVEGKVLMVTFESANREALRASVSPPAILAREFEDVAVHRRHAADSALRGIP